MPPNTRSNLFKNSVHGRGVYASMHWGRPPGRYTPGRYIPAGTLPWQVHTPLAGTLPWAGSPRPGRHTVGQRAVGILMECFLVSHIYILNGAYFNETSHPSLIIADSSSIIQKLLGTRLG